MDSQYAQHPSSYRRQSVEDLDGYNFLPHFVAYPANNLASPDTFSFDGPRSDLQAHMDYGAVQSEQQRLAGPPNWVGWSYEENGDITPAPVKSELFGAAATPSGKRDTRPASICSSAISRFGQLTPPRSSSTTSADSAIKMSPKTSAATNHQNRSTAQVEGANATNITPAATARKRKARRIAAVKPEPATDPEDLSRRKASLEKNRIAAAKCRINKKERTEQLQQDSHNKAVENAQLRDSIIRMKDEMQQLQIMLMSHSCADGCHKPQEIQEYLKHVQQQEYYSPEDDVSQQSYSVDEEQILPSEADQMRRDSYFATNYSQPGFHHPPLPEFNHSEFDSLTPMREE